MSNTSKKIISLIVLLCFAMTQTVTANPGAGIEMAPRFETPSFLQIDIPSELATLDGIYEAPPRPDPRLILHVQNAHANYDAQMKIKELLEYLHKTYAFKTIFVEGAVDTLDPEALKMFPDAARNQKLADLMARQGELNGAELFILGEDEQPGLEEKQGFGVTGNTKEPRVPNPESRAVKAHGIENAALYRENYDALKTVFGAEATVARYLNGFEARLETLSSKVFSKDLRRVLAEWKKFEKGHREFMPYIHNLAAEAKRVLKIDLESLLAQIEWPQITRLLMLQTMEKDLKQDEALVEKERLIAFLSEKGVSPELLAAIKDFQGQRVSVLRGRAETTPAGLEPRDLMEKLVTEAGPKGFRFQDYPEFSVYAGYLILKNEMDPKGLFEEIKTVFTRILDSLAGTVRQKELVELFRDEELVRKLLNLELPRKEWQETVVKKAVLEPSVLVARLKDLSAAINEQGFGTRDSGIEKTKDKGESRGASDESRTSKNAKFRSDVTAVQTAAFKFYEAAHKREDVFYEKIDEVMTRGALSKAVLVTGGFHTDGITDLLREHQISYGILTPRLTEKSNDKLYRTNMLQKQPSMFDLATLELPSRLQKIRDLGLQGVSVEKESQDLASWFFNVVKTDPRNLDAVLEYYNKWLSRRFGYSMSYVKEGSAYILKSQAFDGEGTSYEVTLSPTLDGTYSATAKKIAPVKAETPATPPQGTPSGEEISLTNKDGKKYTIEIDQTESEIVFKVIAENGKEAGRAKALLMSYTDGKPLVVPDFDLIPEVIGPGARAIIFKQLRERLAAKFPKGYWVGAGIENVETRASVARALAHKIKDAKVEALMGDADRYLKALAERPTKLAELEVQLKNLGSEQSPLAVAKRVEIQKNIDSWSKRGDEFDELAVGTFLRRIARSGQPISLSPEELATLKNAFDEKKTSIIVRGFLFLGTEAQSFQLEWRESGNFGFLGWVPSAESEITASAKPAVSIVRADIRAVIDAKTPVALVGQAADLSAASWEDILDYLIRAIDEGKISLERLYVDIDNTLVASMGFHNSEEQKHRLIKLLTEKLGETKAREVLFKFGEKEERRMTQNKFYQPAAGLRVQRLMELKKRGVKIIGVTARPDYEAMRDRTRGLLGVVGIHEGQEVDRLIFRTVLDKTLFTGGAGAEKAKAVQEDLAKDGISSKTAVFVDDQPANTNAVRTGTQTTTVHINAEFLNHENMTRGEYLGLARSAAGEPGFVFEYLINAYDQSMSDVQRQEVLALASTLLVDVPQRDLFMEAVGAQQDFIRDNGLTFDAFNRPGRSVIGQKPLLKIAKNPLPADRRIITIVGLSATLKSETAAAVARALGFLHIDTGQFYRLVAERAARALGAEALDSEEAIAAFLNSDAGKFTFEPRDGELEVSMGGEPATISIRSPEVTANTVRIARYLVVQKTIMQLVRQVGEAHNIVVEGRNLEEVFGGEEDAANVVSFYMKADLDTKAERRRNDFVRDFPGKEPPSLEEVKKSLRERDDADLKRAIAPLRQTEDATVIDTSKLSIQDSARTMVEQYKMIEAFKKSREAEKPAETEGRTWWRAWPMVMASLLLQTGVSVISIAIPELRYKMFVSPERSHVDPFVALSLIGISSAMVLGSFIILAGLLASHPGNPFKPTYRAPGKLKEDGIYRYVRHPMNSTIVVLSASITFLFAAFGATAWILAISGLLTLSVIIYTARMISAEEKHLVKVLEGYSDYRKRTLGVFFLPAALEDRITGFFSGGASAEREPLLEKTGDSRLAETESTVETIARAEVRKGLKEMLFPSDRSFIQSPGFRLLLKWTYPWAVMFLVRTALLSFFPALAGNPWLAFGWMGTLAVVLGDLMEAHSRDAYITRAFRGEPLFMAGLLARYGILFTVFHAPAILFVVFELLEWAGNIDPIGEMHRIRTLVTADEGVKDFDETVTAGRRMFDEINRKLAEKIRVESLEREQSFARSETRSWEKSATLQLSLGEIARDFFAERGIGPTENLWDRSDLQGLIDAWMDRVQASGKWGEGAERLAQFRESLRMYFSQANRDEWDRKKAGPLQPEVFILAVQRVHTLWENPESFGIQPEILKELHLHDIVRQMLLSHGERYAMLARFGFVGPVWQSAREDPMAQKALQNGDLGSVLQGLSRATTLSTVRPVLKAVSTYYGMDLAEVAKRFILNVMEQNASHPFEVLASEGFRKAAAQRVLDQMMEIVLQTVLLDRSLRQNFKMRVRHFMTRGFDSLVVESVSGEGVRSVAKLMMPQNGFTPQEFSDILTRVTGVTNRSPRFSRNSGIYEVALLKNKNSVLEIDERVEGASLKSVLSAGSEISLAERADFADQLMAIHEYLAVNGISDRDVTNLNNVILTPDHLLRHVDFGNVLPLKEIMSRTSLKGSVSEAELEVILRRGAKRKLILAAIKILTGQNMLATSDETMGQSDAALFESGRIQLFADAAAERYGDAARTWLRDVLQMFSGQWSSNSDISGMRAEFQALKSSAPVIQKDTVRTEVRTTPTTRSDIRAKLGRAARLALGAAILAASPIMAQARERAGESFAPQVSMAQQAVSAESFDLKTLWSAVRRQGVLQGVTEKNVRDSIDFSKTQTATVREAQNWLIDQKILTEDPAAIRNTAVLFLRGVAQGNYQKINTRADNFALAFMNLRTVVVDWNAYDALPETERAGWLAEKIGHEIEHILLGENVPVVVQEAATYGVTFRSMKVRGKETPEQLKTQERVAKAFAVLAKNAAALTSPFALNADQFGRLNYDGIWIEDGMIRVRIHDMGVKDGERVMFGVDDAGNLFELKSKTESITRSDLRLQFLIALVVGAGVIIAAHELAHWVAAKIIQRMDRAKGTPSIEKAWFVSLLNRGIVGVRYELAREISLSPTKLYFMNAAGYFADLLLSAIAFGAFLAFFRDFPALVGFSFLSAGMVLIDAVAGYDFYRMNAIQRTLELSEVASTLRRDSSNPVENAAREIVGMENGGARGELPFFRLGNGKIYKFYRGGNFFVDNLSYEWIPTKGEPVTLSLKSVETVRSGRTEYTLFEVINFPRELLGEKPVAAKPSAPIKSPALLAAASNAKEALDAILASFEGLTAGDIQMALRPASDPSQPSQLRDYIGMLDRAGLQKIAEIARDRVVFAIAEAPFQLQAKGLFIPRFKPSNDYASQIRRIYQLGLTAHGVSEEKGGLYNLLNIVLVRNIDGGWRDGGVSLGPLSDDGYDPSQLAASYGPFFVIVDSQQFTRHMEELYANKRWDLVTLDGRIRNLPEDLHAYYLVPDDASKKSLLTGISMWSDQGRLDPATAERLKGKVRTYQELLEDPQAQALGQPVETPSIARADVRETIPEAVLNDLATPATSGMKGAPVVSNVRLPNGVYVVVQAIQVGEFTNFYGARRDGAKSEPFFLAKLPGRMSGPPLVEMPSRGDPLTGGASPALKLTAGRNGNVESVVVRFDSLGNPDRRNPSLRFVGTTLKEAPSRTVTRSSVSVNVYDLDATARQMGITEVHNAASRVQSLGSQPLSIAPEQLRAEFADGVSQSVKTSLTEIFGLMDFMSKEYVSEEERVNFLREIEQSLERMIAFIENLKRPSRRDYLRVRHPGRRGGVDSYFLVGPDTRGYEEYYEQFSKTAEHFSPQTVHRISNLDQWIPVLDEKVQTLSEIVRTVRAVVNGGESLRRGELTRDKYQQFLNGVQGKMNNLHGMILEELALLGAGKSAGTFGTQPLVIRKADGSIDLARTENAMSGLWAKSVARAELRTRVEASEMKNGAFEIEGTVFSIASATNKELVTNGQKQPDVLLLDLDALGSVPKLEAFIFQALFFDSITSPNAKEYRERVAVIKDLKAKGQDSSAKEADLRAFLDRIGYHDSLLPGMVLSRRMAIVVPNEAQRERVARMMLDFFVSADPQQLRQKVEALQGSLPETARFSPETLEAMFREFAANRSFTFPGAAFFDPATGRARPDSEIMSLLAEKMLDVRAADAAGGIDVRGAAGNVRVRYESERQRYLIGEGEGQRSLERDVFAQQSEPVPQWPETQKKTLQRELDPADGSLRVIDFGTGDPTPFSGRQDYTNLALLRNGEMILVDPSIRSIRNLEGLGVAGNVNAIFLTHIHYDHVGGILDLLRRRKAGDSLTRMKLIAAAPVYAQLQMLVADMLGLSEKEAADLLAAAFDWQVPSKVDGSVASYDLGKGFSGIRFQVERTFGHPMSTFGFKATDVQTGASVAYLSDSKMPEPLLKDGTVNPRHAEMVRFFGADLLISENGVPGVHITPDQLIRDFPELVKRGSLFTVHAAGPQTVAGLQRFNPFMVLRTQTMSGREKEIAATERELTGAFPFLAAETRHAIAVATSMSEFKPGEIIFEQGDRVEDSPYVMIHLRGQYSVKVDGREVDVRVPVGLLGEMGIVMKKMTDEKYAELEQSIGGEALGKFTRSLRVGSSTLHVWEAAAPDSMDRLAEGSLKTALKNAWGRAEPLGIRTATVQVTQPSEMLDMGYGTFMALIASYPDLAKWASEISRVRTLADQIMGGMRAIKEQESGLADMGKAYQGAEVAAGIPAATDIKRSDIRKKSEKGAEQALAKAVRINLSEQAEKYARSLPVMNYGDALRHFRRTDVPEDTEIRLEPLTPDELLAMLKEIALESPIEIGVMRLRDADQSWVISKGGAHHCRLRPRGGLHLVDVMIHNHPSDGHPVPSGGDVFNLFFVVGNAAWILGKDGVIAYDTDNLRDPKQTPENNLDLNYHQLEDAIPRGGWEVDPKTGSYSDVAKKAIRDFFKSLNVQISGLTPWADFRAQVLPQKSRDFAEVLFRGNDKERHQALSQFLKFMPVAEAAPYLGLFNDMPHYWTQRLAFEWLTNNFDTEIPGMVKSLEAFTESKFPEIQDGAFGLLISKGVLSAGATAKLHELAERAGFWKLLSRFERVDSKFQDFILSEFAEKIRTDLSSASLKNVKVSPASVAVAARGGYSKEASVMLDGLLKRPERLGDALSGLASSAEGRSLLRSYLAQRGTDIEPQTKIQVASRLRWDDSDGRAVADLLIESIPFSYFHDTFQDPNYDPGGGMSGTYTEFFDRDFLERLQAKSPYDAERAAIMLQAFHNRMSIGNLPEVREWYLSRVKNLPGSKTQGTRAAQKTDITRAELRAAVEKGIKTAEASWQNALRQVEEAAEVADAAIASMRTESTAAHRISLEGAVRRLQEARDGFLQAERNLMRRLESGKGVLENDRYQAFIMDVEGTRISKLRLLEGKLAPGDKTGDYFLEELKRLQVGIDPNETKDLFVESIVKKVPGRKLDDNGLIELKMPPAVGSRFYAKGLWHYETRAAAVRALIRFLREGFPDRFLYEMPITSADNESLGGGSAYGQASPIDSSNGIMLVSAADSSLAKDGIKYVILSPHYKNIMEALTAGFPGVRFLSMEEAPGFLEKELETKKGVKLAAETRVESSTVKAAETRSENRIAREQRETIAKVAEARKGYSVKDFAEALRASGFAEDVKILEGTRFADVMRMRGQENGAASAEDRVAMRVGGILRLAEKDLQAAVLQMHMLAVAIGKKATSTMVDAFRQMYGTSILPAGERRGFVVDFLDGLPSEEKWQAIEAVLALNQNQHYGLGLLGAPDKAFWDRFGALPENMQKRLHVKGDLSEKATAFVLQKTVQAMFGEVQKARGYRGTGDASFVVTGSPAMLDKLGEGLPAALVEHGEDIGADLLDMAGTAAAASFSQELLAGEKLSEKTGAAIKKGDRRYRFDAKGLRGLLAKVFSEIQGLQSIRQAA